jgi:hypothetical protein
VFTSRKSGLVLFIKKTGNFHISRAVSEFCELISAQLCLETAMVFLLTTFCAQTYIFNQTFFQHDLSKSVSLSLFKHQWNIPQCFININIVTILVICQVSEQDHHCAPEHLDGSLSNIFLERLTSVPADPDNPDMYH